MILTVLDAMGFSKQKFEEIVTVMIVVILCTACGTGDAETVKADEKSIADDVQEEQETQETESDITGEKFTQITQCLDEQVPEIFDEWNDYVVEVSEGKVGTTIV